MLVSFLLAVWSTHDFQAPKITYDAKFIVATVVQITPIVRVGRATRTSGCVCMTAMRSSVAPHGLRGSCAFGQRGGLCVLFDTPNSLPTKTNSWSPTRDPEGELNHLVYGLVTAP